MWCLSPDPAILRITEPETSVYRHAVISAARSRAQPSPARPTESFFPFGAIRTRHGHGMERSGGDVRRDVSESADVAVVGVRKL